MASNASSSLEKARYLINLHRHKEAITFLKKLLSQTPNHTRGLALLSLCHLNLNDLEKAITFAKQSNAQEPNFQAYVILTIAYFYTKKYKELKQVIKIGRGLYPYGYEFYKYEALLAKEKQQLRKATRIVDRGLQIAPKKVELHNLKGEILSLRGKTKKAKAAFDVALSIDPNHPQTHCNQGWLALEKGHFSAAQHFFQTALRKAPTDGESYRGYKLALKSEVKWFRPFIRYIAYSIKILPMISIGLIGGIAPQAGKLATEAWNDFGFLMLMSKIILGVILFFWLPFFLSAVAGLELAEQAAYKRFFGGAEKQFAKRHIVIYLLVLAIFVLLLLCT